MSEEKTPLGCAQCGTTACRNADSVQGYLDDEESLHIATVSAGIQHDYFKKLLRADETVLFIKRMGYRKVGVACCTALVKEARIFCKMLELAGIDYFSLSCKAGAQDKSSIGIPEKLKIAGPGCHESMCNPVLQARVLKQEGCDFNVLLGLCVGHDSLFFMHTDVPTTVLVCKDPITHHCPAQALTPEAFQQYQPVE